jgi:hypothetical protein
LSEELAVPFDKRYNHPAALSTSKFGVKQSELFRICFNWQKLLMKRNSFIYVFKFIQVMLLPFWLKSQNSFLVISEMISLGLIEKIINVNFLTMRAG